MLTSHKPYSESCEQNRDPILAVIKPLLAGCKQLLEIGTGTGQHAVYFAEHLPGLHWQTSDLAENHAGIRAWLETSTSDNIGLPISLDVSDASRWPPMGSYDACYSANTTHIMASDEVAAMITGVGKVLASGGHFLLYGPFNYDGQYTSDSNARFDEWLKLRDPASGIRDFEQLDQLANAAGMQLLHDYPMPANNRILHWRKTG